MNLFLLALRAYLSILETNHEDHQTDDEYKKYIISALQVKILHDFIFIRDHIDREGKALFFGKRAVAFGAFAALSILSTATLIPSIAFSVFALFEIPVLAMSILSVKLTNNEEFMSLDRNLMKAKYKEYSSRLRVLKKMRRLKKSGKTDEEIIHIIEMDREVDNSLELDYQVRSISNKKELDERLKEDHFILNRKTPLVVRASLEVARRTGKFDSLYKIDPRHLNYDALCTIDKSPVPLVRDPDNRPFYDYEHFTRNADSVKTNRDYLKYHIYQDDAVALYDYGRDCGLVKPFPDYLINEARNYCNDDDSIPMSFKLLISDFSERKCYTFSSFVEEILLNDGHNVKRERAIIDSIALNPNSEDGGFYDRHNRVYYGVHHYVIEKMEDGTEWVYDTAQHFMVEKNFFYACNRARCVASAEEKPLMHCVEKTSLDDNPGNLLDYILFLSKEEEYVASSDTPDVLRKEFDTCKQMIGYETMVDKFGIRDIIESSRQKKLDK